jgi:uncharacterized protein YbjT (DUF2867 family)
MIVVTGGTGTIGREVIRQLSESGQAVRALSRNPPPGDARAGVEWMQADLSNPGELTASLAGGTRLFLLTGNSADMVRLQKNAIRAAAGAGVPTVIKLSALGASDHSRSVIGLWHYNVERELRESGLRWTILRPHHFMQNFLDPMVFDRVSGRVHSAAGDGAIPFIDTRDIAAVAARVLVDPDAHAGQTYTLTGAEAVSYAEATDRISRVIGRSLTHVAETVDESWARRRAAGQPTWMVAAQLAIAEYQRAGGLTARTVDDMARITGGRPRTVEEFAADHADRLAS